MLFEIFMILPVTVLQSFFTRQKNWTVIVCKYCVLNYQIETLIIKLPVPNVSIVFSFYNNFSIKKKKKINTLSIFCCRYRSLSILINDSVLTSSSWRFGDFVERNAWSTFWRLIVNRVIKKLAFSVVHSICCCWIPGDQGSQRFNSKTLLYRW